MCSETFRLGFFALVTGSPKIDWRDALGAFAIFEECGKRLGVSFQSEIEQSVSLSNDPKLRSLLDQFFARNDEMRTVDIMGFQQVGDGEESTFVSKGTF